MVKVSIILPTYNRAHLLEESIKSILGQTYPHFELIIIDDGSTDQTPEVVKSFKEKRIKYLRQRKQKGAAAARNLGLKKAKGDLIAFNDDDDIWHQKKLEKQVKTFAKAKPNVGVIYTRMRRMKDKEVKYFPGEAVGKKSGKIQKELFLENFIGLPTAMIRKECFQKIGSFDEKITRYEDWDLFLRISQFFEFQYLPQALVDSPILPSGLTSKREVVLKDSEIIFQKHRKEIEEDKQVLASWQFRLGDLYYHQGKMKKARKFFQGALNNRFSFRYIRAIAKTYLGKNLSEALINLKLGQTQYWPILAVLALALVLRLINLNQSLWLDEAVQAITAQGQFKEIFPELRGDFHPPFYHFLIWSWVQLFGASEVILRLPSVFFGVATVSLVYLIAQEFLSKRQSIIPALFMATAPFHIYYSQEARNYALTTFLTTLSFFFFLKIADKRPKKKSIVAYLTTTALLLYTNYFGLLILFTQALISLWKRGWRQLQWVLSCFFLFLPNLFLLKTQISLGRGAITSLPEWGRLVNVGFLKAIPLTFIKFSLGRITFFNKQLYALITGFLFIFYGIVIGRGLTSKKKPIVFLCWLVIPIGSAWAISFFIPNYQPFRLLLVLPAFYLLLAWGVSQFKEETQTFLTILIVMINLVSLSVYYTNPYFHREDWRGLVKFIDYQPIEKKAVLLPSYTSHWPLTYYSLRTPLVSLSQGFQTVETEKIPEIPDESTLYYIRYLVPMFDPQEKTISWLNQNGFVKIKEVSFNQIPIWIYEPL